MIFDLKKLHGYIGIILLSFLGALNSTLLVAAPLAFAARTMSLAHDEGIAAMALALFIAPFLVFSHYAGHLADRTEKAQLIRSLKWSDPSISVAAIALLSTGSATWLLLLPLLAGVQASLFWPVKMSWLSERIDPNHLIRLNGWLGTGVVLGILGGFSIDTLLADPGSLIWVGIASLVLSLLGLAASQMMPKRKTDIPQADQDSERNNHPLTSDRVGRRASFLLAWAAAVGTVSIITLIATLHQNLLGSLGPAALGITLIGAIAGFILSAHQMPLTPSARLTIPAAAILGLAAFGLSIGVTHLSAADQASWLVTTASGGLTSLCLALFSLAGAMFTAPLFSLIQFRSAPDTRGRVMAGVALFCAGGAALAFLLVESALHSGATPSIVLVWVGLSAALIAILSAVLFPREALQTLGRLILKTWFRVEIDGAEHLHTTGPAIYVANHTSFVDGPLLFSLIDREVSIAVHTAWAKGKLLGWLGGILNIAPVDPQKPMAAKALAHSIRAGGAALIFPEGRISTHGALMKVYPGTAWLVDAAQAPVISISIDGLASSIFTRRIPGLARRIFPKVRIRISAPQRLDISAELRGKARREAATGALQDMLQAGRFASLSYPRSIPQAFHEARKSLDPKAIAIQDPLGTSLTRGKLAVAAAAFSEILQHKTAPGEHVGVLLPGVAAAPVVLLGLWRAGRAAAILNPTLGTAPMLSTIETAGIRTILSSHAFVEKAGLGTLVADLEAQGIAFLWTEDLKAGIDFRAKLRAALAARRAADVRLSPNDPAVVLFTSGTEGAPKGVVLTHGNLVANTAQIRTRTDVSASDRVITALPLFHSFGLTAGVLLPLLAGASLMIYPSPLHYRVIPEVSYAHRATLIFGTDTFFAGWGRRASPYDFSSIRAAIAGAEPVKAATRDLWMTRFGVRILEGYGATEAGPVVALNTPMENRPGTVGRPMPGLETRLEDAPGTGGRRLLIRGPNVMAGYLLSGKEGLHAPDAGWYDTGDIVQIDDDGFISIVGRAKRFAKVGGEMVSLAAAETLGAQVWPDAQVAAIAVPDARKGERVILAVTAAGATRADLSSAAKAAGLAEITVPSEVLVLDKIPLLASGKADYPALSRLIADNSQVAA